jgi:hypothetical protein
MRGRSRRLDGEVRENGLMSDMSDYLVGVIGAATTLAITKGVPWLLRAYDKRYVDPHRAHQDLFLEQANWFSERSEKLAVFRHQLIFNPPSDKFKLAFLVAQLDPKDREWAMKEADIETLCNYAAHKGTECYENACECARNADQINYRTFIFPLA